MPCELSAKTVSQVEREVMGSRYRLILIVVIAIVAIVAIIAGGLVLWPLVESWLNELLYSPI